MEDCEVPVRCSPSLWIVADQTVPSIEMSVSPLIVTCPVMVLLPSHVIVEVCDTGIGMDAEAIGRIFEPYFSTKATGTGLGLTIAKRNVELIGGTIAVSSARGTGTTVTMRLPVVHEAAGHSAIIRP